MANKIRNGWGGLMLAIAGMMPMVPAQAADSMLDWKDLNFVRIYHAYSANDGKSYLEEIPIPAMPSVGKSGTPVQTYFNFKEPHQVVIGRAVQGAMFEWHGAVEYRHLIIPLQGDTFFDLGDGRTLNLKPGEAILAEDWTGRGHRSGCAPSKTQMTCVGIDILIDPNPHAMPLRAPPQP